MASRTYLKAHTTSYRLSHVFNELRAAAERLAEVDVDRRSSKSSPAQIRRAGSQYMKIRKRATALLAKFNRQDEAVIARIQAGSTAPVAKKTTARKSAKKRS